MTIGNGNLDPNRLFSSDPSTRDVARDDHLVTYLRHNKIYDIELHDWVESLVKEDPFPQKTSRFWCSALVGYIYTQCDVLIPETDWSILAPNDFSLSGETVRFMPPFSLFPQENKIQ